MTRHWQVVAGAPKLPELYWRAATRRKITGSVLPNDGLRAWLNVDAQAVAAYRKVCGFTENGLLPATYPHVLAFGLQLQLLTAQAFPFPLLGLVHLANRIRLLRPLGDSVGSRPAFTCRTCNPMPRARRSTWSPAWTMPWGRCGKPKAGCCAKA